jgi:hypothetical protein
MKHDYFIVGDINSSPCVIDKKHKICGKFKNANYERIVITKKEIEGWYLAGMGELFSKKYKLKSHKDTNTLTKEQFNQLIPKQFDSRIDFMSEILKHFSIPIAKKKNMTFRYFWDKFIV